MMVFTLLLILAGCGVAFFNWRWGVVAAIVVGMAQDPLRKVIPGTPAFLAMGSIPVWMATLAAAAYRRQLSVRDFFSTFPRLALWIRVFALYLVIPATNSVTWGAGTWKITLLGLFVYTASFLALVAGWRYPVRRGDAWRLLGFYAVITAVFLAGGPLDSWGWSERYPFIGTTTMGHLWLTHRTQAAVFMLAGFFRSPDIMGWHAALVFMVAVIMAFRARGAARAAWIALAVWGLLNVWLCGRRKMLAMLPVFLGCYVFLISRFKSVRRLVAGVGTVLLIAGLGWYFIMALEQDQAVERFYLTTLTEAGGRVQEHGYRSIFSTVSQAGFWGYGLGMSQQGIHNIEAEKPRVWQESGPPKLVAELGVPGAILFLIMGGVLIATAYQVVRLVRRDEDFYILAGMLSVLAANMASGIVSAQIFGDPLVALLLSFLIGLLLSGVRTPSRPGAGRQEAAALPPEVEMVRPPRLR